MARQRRSMKVADLLGDDGEMLGEMGDLGRAFAAGLNQEQEPSVRLKSPFRRHEVSWSTTVEGMCTQADDVERR